MKVFLIFQVLILVSVTIALPNFSTETRIVGGKTARRNQFKFTVAISRFIEPTVKVYCTGSLVGDNVILTAAHCLDPLHSVTVNLGKYDLTKTESSELTFEIENGLFLIHPDYDSKTIKNDIAIIWLPEPIEFTNSIRPIALPRRSQQKETFGGRKATAIGWGRFSDKKPEISPILRYVELPVIENEVCREMFHNIPDTNICTNGTGEKSTCNGDSGGPLMCKDKDGTQRLIGITSFGLVKCELGAPSAFTRVTSYLDWIEANTGIHIEA